MSMGMRDSLRFVLRRQFARFKFLAIGLGGAVAIMLISFFIMACIFGFIGVPDSIAMWVLLVWVLVTAGAIQLWKSALYAGH